MNFKLSLSVAALSVLAASSQATTWTLNYAPGSNQNGNGGYVNSITTTYNDVTQDFRYEANFSNSAAGTLPDGFWLVMSDGPNPKGHAGQLAIYYFDTGVTNNGVAKLTSYAYNGVNGDNSYLDGSGASGTQAPDKIRSSVADSSWINQLSVVNNGNGTRTMVMDIKASVINSHTPMYPGNTGWEGTAFGPQAGLWFHTVDGLNATYGNDGFLKNFTYSKSGWVDAENLAAVPEPGTIALLAGMGLAIARKRSKK